MRCNSIVQVETFKMFCDLAETKNFTKTAKRNDVTQSAISQMLSSLEFNLGVKLVERISGGKRPFKLTPQGQYTELVPKIRTTG